MISLTLLIDGDGCPVVDDAVRIGRKFGIAVVILCDTSHEMQRDGAETVTVSKGADSADFALLNRLHPGDAVVTQDYGLAALCLAKRCFPIHQDGWLYTDDNIDGLLASRAAVKKMVRSGKHPTGMKKRTKQQNEDFRAGLSALLAKLTA